MIRNLVYFLWPNESGTGMWQWNVRQLLKRIDQFDGQRFVAIVTGQNTTTFDEAKAAFKGTVPVNNFLRFDNNSSLGETVAFRSLLQRVENIDPRQITFYAHGKGVKYALGDEHLPQVKQWARTMYAVCLDYPKLVESQLQTLYFSGAFRKTDVEGQRPKTVGCDWHYAGTFFWFRNDKAFQKSSWDRIPRAYFGSEVWPGLICAEEQAGKLFYHGVGPSLQLYNADYWQDNVIPVWKTWQTQHFPLLRSSTYKEVLNSLSGKRVVVSGPQRSGTNIAAKCLAHDLGVPLIPEVVFLSDPQQPGDFMRFIETISGKEGYVIHAPTVSPYLHLLNNCEVVWLRRDPGDVLLSQERISWQHEEPERDRYFDHSCDPIHTVKTRAWDQFQRQSLTDRAFDLDYESLRGHELWVDKEGRSAFRPRQTEQAGYSC